jgi:hypothetical protein
VLPHVFVDRSLGALQVPRLLRAAGIKLTTMREHYGEEVGQSVDDVDWLIEIADREWIGFCKDAAIKRNEAERETVIARGARLFVVPRADVSAAEVAARFTNNLAAITRAAAEPGPFIYSVQLTRIQRLL